VEVPPTGVRDAVPLGGLGGGTFELRGDGTLAELTLHSASPGGAAKYATQPEALLSLRTAGGVTRALRTAPPPWAAPGVATIAYAGAYPVSRLAVGDPALAAAGLSATLFAYHRLSPGDAPASSAPAAVFTLSLTNTGAAPTNASLLFQLPFGAMRDCARGDFPVAAASVEVGYAACLAACGAGCAAWNYDAASGNCSQLAGAGRMVYRAGSFCGVRGTWSSADGVSLGLSMHPGDAASEAGPAVGDVALRPVGAAGAALSFGVADDPAALYAAFAAGGGFPQGTAAGVTGGAFAGVTAAHGAVAVTSPSIAPGETASISITFAWYFPHRDFYQRTVGQFYSTQWDSARDVAALYSMEHLAAIAAEAAAHTSSFAETSLPAWLGDHMVRGGAWGVGGRPCVARRAA
jgi:hypothetical protein